MGKDTKEEGRISWSGVTIAFLIGTIVIIVAICLREKFYTPPQARMDAQKVVDQKAQEEKKRKAALKKRADHAKSSVRQEKRQREKVLAPAVIEPMQVAKTETQTPAPPSSLKPVLDVPKSMTWEDVPYVKAVPATSDVVAGNNKIAVVVVEAPARQDRYGYVYGAFGGNFNPNAGVYCNGYGNNGWSCPQFQSNFVNQAPVFVQPPTVFVQSAPAPAPHHEHHHRRHHNEPPHSGGPAPRAGF